ncbi:MAG TPA: nuclear transport factor 2 family protein [Kofleriaceae bacterium]|nr:nuclear transport factor 2 family protein [Kofleriaceae bacterium]
MRAVALGLVAVIGCGGASTPAAKAPKEDAVDERKAEKGAKDLVGEIYESIGTGDTDGLMSLLADPLIVFGPRRTDAMGTRADALVALKAQIDPKAKKKPAVRSGSLEVVASPGGHSAWAIDVLDVAGQPMALTAVLTNADDIWQVHAAALAATPPMRSIRAELKKDAIVPPGLSGVAKLDPGAQAAVDKFKKGLADQDVWGTDLASRTDAALIGPATGDVTRGKAEIKKLWKKRMKANTRATAAGDITAEVTPDGELAWVSAPVVQFADDDDPLPLRDFAVFEKSGGEWTLIALQESLAFDAPGAGVNYRKAQPPALAKAVEEPKKEAPPPDKAKKAKKKKKKKHTDDDN